MKGAVSLDVRFRTRLERSQRVAGEASVDVATGHSESEPSRGPVSNPICDEARFPRDAGTPARPARSAVAREKRESRHPARIPRLLKLDSRHKRCWRARFPRETSERHCSAVGVSVQPPPRMTAPDELRSNPRNCGTTLRQVPSADWNAGAARFTSGPRVIATLPEPNRGSGNPGTPCARMQAAYWTNCRS